MLTVLYSEGFSPMRPMRMVFAMIVLGLSALAIGLSAPVLASTGTAALPVAPPPCPIADAGARAADPGPDADAATRDQARGLFRKGCFDAARAAALALAADESKPAMLRAENYAFAARAVLSAVMVEPLSPRAAGLIEEAETLAGQAVRIDGSVVEGHLQRAIALGLQARAVNPVEAASGGYAEEARAHIDAALKLAPEEPYALAVDGAWHLEVVTGAGSFAAAVIYGADADDGVARYEAARAMPGASLMIDVQYAAAALVLDHKRHAKAARKALEAARTKTPVDAVERFHHEVAGALLATLSSPAGSRDGARLAAAIQGRR